jgi:acyl dehydratase
VTQYLEDLPVGHVSLFGSYAVTAEEIKSFAKAYDPQPFHLDEAAGATSAMGVFCASGWHTASMAMRMAVDENQRLGAQFLGSPGVDEIRWLRPVVPGDILSVRVTVQDVWLSSSKPDRGTIRLGHEVINQRGDIVMTYIATVFYLRRPA